MPSINQPAIAHWNLRALALGAVQPDPQATQLLETLDQL